MCSASSASIKMLIRDCGVAYKDLIPGTSQIEMSTVCVYVNKHGNLGSYLDWKKIQKLPDHLGLGSGGLCRPVWICH